MRSLLPTENNKQFLMSFPLSREGGGREEEDRNPHFILNVGQKITDTDVVCEKIYLSMMK